MNSLRIVFMGTPEFSVPTLFEIIGAGYEIAAVYTQPPRPAGRGKQDRKSPIQEFAEKAGLPVLTPKSLEGEAEQTTFRDHQADAAVVVAYGLLLPTPILDTPRYGCFNLHASLLPRWRGAAPIQRAIMAGDRETGAMIMRIEEGLDTGPICLGEQTEIGPDMTAGELHDELARRGADLMIRALAALARGSLDCSPQRKEGVTYAKKIEKSETRIDWSRPAEDVHNHIRGLSPFPGAWFEAEYQGRLERVKVLRTQLSDKSGAPGSVLDGLPTIACGEGAVLLVQLQRAGKKAMSGDEFLRGFPLAPGGNLR